MRLCPKVNLYMLVATLEGILEMRQHFQLNLVLCSKSTDQPLGLSEGPGIVFCKSNNTTVVKL